VSEEQDQGQQVTKKARVSKATQEQALGPQKSYWPIGLAIALVILLIGLISNSIVVLGIGVVLSVAAVIGWGLEQRK
jgi:Zn-dependent membrane protease YugP